jgi:hypothetical protein
MSSGVLQLVEAFLAMNSKDLTLYLATYRKRLSSRFENARKCLQRCQAWAHGADGSTREPKTVLGYKGQSAD